MPTATDDRLVIMFPATSGYLKVSRLNATAFAADRGFSVDELDDLRLAVDEAVTWLLRDESHGGQVVLTLGLDNGSLRLTGERAVEGLPDQDIGDLAHAILGATVDSYELETSAEARRLSLEKSLS